MSVELVHSQPCADLEKRVIRMQEDALMLRRLKRAEIRALYDKIEWTRDVLSRLLDHADGKNA